MQTNKQNDTEGKKLLEGTKKLEEAWTFTNATTIGAYFASQYSQGEKVRNGNGQYDHTPLRKFLTEEVAKLFANQRKLGNPVATTDIEATYLEKAFTQRPLQSSAKMVGKCEHEPKEPRAPKLSFSSEMFLLYSALRKLKLLDPRLPDTRLTPDDEQKVLEHLFTHSKTTFGQIRKLLNMPDTTRFNTVSYRQTKKGAKDDWDSLRKSSEEREFSKFTGTKALMEATGLKPLEDEKAAILFDKIAWVLTTQQDPEKIRKELAALNLTPETIEKCLGKTDIFTKHISLSVKAIGKIMPLMRHGMLYNDAVEAAGYTFNKNLIKGEKNKLPPIDAITNPLVARAMAQARKVLNAIIAKHGMPEHIVIELARDLSRDFDERKKMERENKANEERKASQKAHLEELFGREVNGTELLKYRLWQEQGQRCAYSDKPITVDMLKNPQLLEIDHILPQSRSFDDSYMNKVLCFTTEDQKKANNTPHEAWGNSGDHWRTLEVFAERLPKPKRERFLMVDYADKQDGWKARHLTDTRYIGALLKKHIETHLAFPAHIKKPVHVTNGKITSHLRGIWGLGSLKNRGESDTHHALDAIVIACTSESMVQKMSEWNRFQRTQGGAKIHFEKPWETFRDDVKNKLDSLFVSRQPSRKVTGAAHEETIRSDRRDRGLGVVETKRITTINLKTLERMVEKDVRNNKLYQVLKARLEAHNDKPEVAFAEPAFHEYLKETWAAKAPRITSLKLISSEASGIAINGGLASNGGMVRVDVFTKEHPKKKGKLEYYLCPIYVADYVKATLPNKLMVPGKKESEWLDINGDFQFLFHLYKNDVVRLTTAKGDIIEGYYDGAHRSNAQINLKHHDGNPEKYKESIGVKTLATFEKYSVDYFGNRTLIKKEKRHELAHRRRKPKGAPLAETEPASS